ncbi:neutral zinc metallopeptidase [Rhodococcus sp. X156]|uniref:neutral zinc metallopeptidase n=1 Tax=Rhodococcus sp. X156 TaxID=2499145 RepID=UPI000FDCDD8E|nr:neutral zinc metallopeptidase [Rhodococcus sp. X156]
MNSSRTPAASQRSSRSRGAALWGTVLLVLTLATGCSTVVNGSATSIYSDPQLVSGLRVSEGPSGPRNGVGRADLAVRGISDDPVDTLAVNAVADAEAFWQETYPAVFGSPLEKVEKLVSYDSSVDSDEEICGADTYKLVNAFYCSTEHLIGWDRGKLLPAIESRFGAMGVVTVLAHEYGHAVQRRAKLNAKAPTLVTEQQADCFGGAFMRTVAEGKAKHFTLNTANGLNAVLATTIAVRDKEGMAPSDKRAHGSAFDRVSAFQFGFTDGAARCAKIDTEEVRKRIANLPNKFDSSSDTGELAVTERNVGSVIESLKESFRSNNVAEPTVSYTDTGPCTDAKSTPPVSYCPATNTLTVDVPGLAARAEKADDTDNDALPDSVSGDFSAYVLLASRYTLAVQKGLGASLDGELVGLRSACYAGGYAAATSEPTGTLRLSPGDLDEAVSGLLTDGLAASDVNGKEAPSGFTRVEAFRTGVLDGAATCATVYGG